MAIVTARAKRLEQAVDAEADLIARARAKEPAAWDTLYAAHYEAIHRYAYVRVGDPHVAEDLAAEVFLQAVRSIGRYEYRGIAFRAWLYRIAHNLTAGHQRRQLSRGPVDPLPDEPIIGAAVDLAEQVAGWSDLQAAVRRLTDEQQQVVILRFVEGLSLAEVAQATGRTAGAVKALQHRAVNRLRQLTRTRSEVS